MSFISRLIIIFGFYTSYVVAQPTKMITHKDNYNWMFGASWMMLDDDGDKSNLFNFTDYHSAVFPTRVFIDKFIFNSWSMEGSFCFQKYDSMKLVNDSARVNGNLFGFDVHSKQSFFKLLGRGWIDPYVFAGGGLTTRTLDIRNSAKSFSIHANVGGGINFWVSYNIGLQLQSVAKFSINDFWGPSNYIMHTAGLVVRLEKSDGTNNDFAKSKYKVKKSRTKIKMQKGKRNRKES